MSAGLARLGATKAAGYQEHPGEYGDHWNFFFTLAAVALLTSAVRIPGRALLPVGAALLVGHQAALSWGGLSAVVHSDLRGASLLSRNKEGVLSIPGYWALHLLSAGAGRLLQGSAGAAAVAAVVPLGEGKLYPRVTKPQIPPFPKTHPTLNRNSPEYETTVVDSFV